MAEATDCIETTAIVPDPTLACSDGKASAEGPDEETKPTEEGSQEKLPPTADSEPDPTTDPSDTGSRKSEKKRKSIMMVDDRQKSKIPKPESTPKSDKEGESGPAAKPSPSKSFSILNILNNDKSPGNETDQKVSGQPKPDVTAPIAATVPSSFPNTGTPFAAQYLPPAALTYWYPWLPFYQLDAATLKQRNGKSLLRSVLPVSSAAYVSRLDCIASFDPFDGFESP